MQHPNDLEKSTANTSDFRKKIWTIAIIFAFTVALLLIIKSAFNVLLLVLAGVLIAIYFRALSSKIQRKTKWKEVICVTISIIATLGTITALFWLIGSKVHEQIVELMDTLPKTIANAKNWLNNSEIGEDIMDEASSKKTSEEATKIAGKFFQSTFGIFGDLYAIFFIGIFFTISPQTYTQGLDNCYR